VRQLGPFAIGGQQFTMSLEMKKIAGTVGQPPPEGASETLWELEILDTNGNVVYQETFPYALANGRFVQVTTASAYVLSGNGGAALVIRFLTVPAVEPGTEGNPGRESWQVFGLVNGRFASFGAVLPVGQGANITVGGVVAGVMVRGGIAVVPLASTAERLEFRAWTGNFYAFVPVRVDWTGGQWGEGEQCYGLAGGTLQKGGCNMRVEARREIQPGDTATAASLRLFSAPDGDPYNAQTVSVRSDSQTEFLETRAVVRWRESGQRVECTFDDVWLHVIIDGLEGWVHTEADFAALGLPLSSPR
jgi:hypothetical protein